MGRLGAGGALGTVIAVLVAGCGGHSSPQRKAVESYLNDVNQVEQALAREVASVNIAYRKFRAGNKMPKVQELRAAERTMRTLRSHLAKLVPPRSALAIHRDLLRLFEQDALVAHELTIMAVFLPRFLKTDAPFAAAHRALSAGLGKATKPATQAAVLERYAASCRAGLASLRGLAPPAVLAPLYDSRVAHLRTAESLSTRLAAALRHGDRLRVPGLSMRLEALESGVEELNGANAEAIAVADYSRRLEDIGRLEARIEREVERLQTRLG